MTNNRIVAETCRDAVFLGIQLLLRGISRSQPPGFNPVSEVPGGESRSSFGVRLPFQNRSDTSES